MKFRPRGMPEQEDNSRGGKEGWRSRGKGILSAVVILAALYLGLGLLADLVVGWVPPRTEAKWFAWAETLVEPSLPVPDDLQLLFDRLLLDAELEDFPYRLVFLPSEEVNAFALPGGLVAVTRGLYESVESPTGRALVLAHEIGHVEHRHGLERIGRSILLAGAMSLVGVDASTVLQRSQFLADLQFSRSQESESDDFGLRMVYRSFGTTEGAMEFFEDLQLLEGATSPLQLGAFLRTHPLSSERLEELRDLAEELEAGA